MHEIGLVAKGAAVLLARDHLVNGVRVLVGPRADRAVVETAWIELVRGTPLALADVVFDEARDEMVCFSCATPYAGDELGTCPACGGNGLPRQLAADVVIEERVPCA